MTVIERAIESEKKRKYKLEKDLSVGVKKMIDYKSPIEIWHSEMEMQLEGEVLKACQRVGVQVDKDELLKALQYDRGQYEKGYQDGLNADKWISCEERLPENDTDVLVCSGEFVHEAHFKDGNFSNAYGMWYRAIKHWQPLPQPYKKEGAE